MKIMCTVEVLNRALPTLNMKSGKAVRSSLTIGKSPDNDIFILHQTNQNLIGKKYKIKNNIANVFVKFVNEGKATIRFKVPEHDLAIKCCPIQLKGFLRTLKLGLDGASLHQLSNLDPINSVQNKLIKSTKTKLKITSKEEYPVLEGFPRTLESLVINSAFQKTLDSRILRLRNLSILNMENNNLTTLPEQLGSSLPNLTELYLGSNKLGSGLNWKWIVNCKLQNQLKLLDLRSNEIAQLPDKIVKLNLVSLKLDNNCLQTLPNALGCMKNLRYFSASKNMISYVPGSILRLQLESIDLSENMFCDLHRKLTNHDFQLVPSLLDIAGSCVITSKLEYTEGTLPQTLIEYLESASFCFCGKPCFSVQPQSFIPLRMHSRVSTIVTSHSSTYTTVAVRYCSLQCYNKSENTYL